VRPLASLSAGCGPLPPCPPSTHLAQADADHVALARHTSPHTCPPCHTRPPCLDTVAGVCTCPHRIQTGLFIHPRPYLKALCTCWYAIMHLLVRSIRPKKRTNMSVVRYIRPKHAPSFDPSMPLHSSRYTLRPGKAAYSVPSVPSIPSAPEQPPGQQGHPHRRPPGQQGHPHRRPPGQQGHPHSHHIPTARIPAASGRRAPPKRSNLLRMPQDRTPWSMAPTRTIPHAPYGWTTG
jgi:hypothetical protein